MNSKLIRLIAILILATISLVTSLCGVILDNIPLVIIGGSILIIAYVWCLVSYLFVGRSENNQ